MHELQLLNIVAGQVALQLENSRLYEEEIAKEKEAAVNDQDYERAQELRDRESAAKAKADQLRSDWQEAPRGDGNPEGLSGEMTRSDAYAILGLEEGSSREQIIAAHGRLIQRLHPDRGGSTFLAAKINQARDLLLGA